MLLWVSISKFRIKNINGIVLGEPWTEEEELSLLMCNVISEFVHKRIFKNNLEALSHWIVKVIDRSEHQIGQQLTYLLYMESYRHKVRALTEEWLSIFYSLAKEESFMDRFYQINTEEEFQTKLLELYAEFEKRLVFSITRSKCFY
jgi:hypothetical protein